MNKTVFVLGNEMMQKDALAVFVGRRLKGLNGFEFKHIEDPIQLFELKDEQILVMDVVRGIHEVKWMEDVHQLKRWGLCTLHDFDFAFFTELMLAKGATKKFKILGLPFGYPPEKAVNDAKTLLEAEFSQ
ncbi:MAG: hypothetical protein V1834_02600 [Candidatus Micrarchaeota archaeon]